MKLQIEKEVYGGAGLAHQIEGEGAGRAVFVPFTLPGELVEAHLLEEKDAFGEASVAQVLSASEDRVQPACAHFGKCGGCHYQHAAYPAQLQMKAAILLETLERAGLTALPAIHTHAGEPWAYRNRTRLRVDELDSFLRVGYNRRGSNYFLAVQECPILAPLLWRTAEVLLRVSAEDSTAARWLRGAVEVELFTTGNEKKLQMTVFVRKEQAGLSELCERMQALVPELASAYASLLPLAGPHRRARSPRQLERWGSDGLSYHAVGEDYWVGHGGFFQVNRFLVDELVRIVTAGRRGVVAWDLYAGVGLFSRALAGAFQQVVAIEAAANDLSRSFRGRGRRAVEATTLEFLRSAVVQRERPELIVMGPSQGRRGCGGLCSVGESFCARDRLRLLRSCDPRPRSKVARRGRLSPGRPAHGRHVPSNVSSGDSSGFAQEVVNALW